MPFSLTRAPSLVTVATLVVGIALNVAMGAGAQAVARPAGTPAPSSSSSPAPTGPQPTPSATATPTPVPTPLPEPVAASLSRTSGGTAARTTVVMRGTAMANVARVIVGGRDAQQLSLVSPTELRFVVPEADGFVPGTVAISLVSATDAARIGTSLTWTYAVRTGVDREMAYAATHWNLHSSARFGYIPKNDCVNFTSQLLLTRGWHESAAWWNDGPVSHTVTVKQTVLVPTKVTVPAPKRATAPAPVPKPTSSAKASPAKATPAASAPAKGAPAEAVPTKGAPAAAHPAAPAPKPVVTTVMKKVVRTVKKVVTTVDASAAWVSSTAMSSWLASRHDLATHLSYAQRAGVRIGDVVQFNWSGVGSSWDHTAVVSKIVVGANGSVDIWYAEHTNHQLYGGSIGTLLKLPEYRHMKVQFWRLTH